MNITMECNNVMQQALNITSYSFVQLETNPFSGSPRNTYRLNTQCWYTH